MLSGYPVVTEIVVRWGDMDALGHVNNIVYLQYFETARINYHERVGIRPPSAGSGADGVILAANSCRYKVPVTYPDTLAVGARIAALGEDSFLMEYAAVSRRLGRVAAEGDALVVLYDFSTRRRIPISADLRSAITALEGHEPPELPPKPR